MIQKTILKIVEYSLNKNNVQSLIKKYVLSTLYRLFKGEIIEEIIKEAEQDKEYANYIVTKIVPKDMPVIMNITVTSDILHYNKVYHKNSILENIKIKKVSDKQSFIYSPNVTYVH